MPLLLLNIVIALKKKHSKTDDDTKFVGTVLGRSNDHGYVLVEGSPYTSISTWEEKMRLANQKPPALPGSQEPGDREVSPAASSGLSSLGDRTIGEDMDLS